jgi:hypothetical protein
MKARYCPSLYTLSWSSLFVLRCVIAIKGCLWRVYRYFVDKGISRSERKQVLFLRPFALSIFLSIMATAIFDVKHWLDGNSVHLMMATRPFQNGGKLISRLEWSPFQ